MRISDWSSDVCSSDLERADEAVVIVDRGREARSYLPQMARDDRQPVVHLLAQRTDGLRLGRKLFLPPDRRHRPRDRDEIGRRGEQHPLLEGKVPKRGVMLKRGRKKMLAGHEHDHKVWSIAELVPVIHRNSVV